MTDIPYSQRREADTRKTALEEKEKKQRSCLTQRNHTVLLTLRPRLQISTLYNETIRAADRMPRWCRDVQRSMSQHNHRGFGIWSDAPFQSASLPPIALHSLQRLESLLYMGFWVFLLPSSHCVVKTSGPSHSLSQCSGHHCRLNDF